MLRIIVWLSIFYVAGTLQLAAQAAPQPHKIGSVNVQGSLRARGEFWGWFESDADSSYAYSGNIFRLSFSQQKKAFDWQVELAAPFLLGLPERALGPGAQGQLGLGASYYVSNGRSRNAGMIFPKQTFVRLKGLFGDAGQSLRLGRFEFVDGSEATPKDPTLAAVKRDRIAQRLIGHFGFTHVGRSLDGFHYTVNRPKVNFTLVGAMPTRGVFQVDGWGNLHVGVLYASLTGQVIGKGHNGEYRALGIYYHDWRKVVKTDNRPLALRQRDLANIRLGTFGGHYIHAANTSAGVVDLMGWSVLQTGRWGLIDHWGGAAALEGGWQPKGLKKLRPWLRGGYNRATGDSNPLDDTHGTFFQVLPTVRVYARFPFFDMLNNEDIFGSLILRPHKNLSIRADVRGLRLTERADMWYVGGGAFQPWTFGYVGRASNGNRGLATLFDAGADYTFNANLALGAYFGHAAGKSVVSSIYPKGPGGNFGYLELTYRF